MRNVIVLAVLLLVAAACNADRLTGANARRALVEGKARFGAIPDSIAVFVDGVRQPAGAQLDVRPETVERIEVVKRDAAVARFGPQAAGGAIFIYTKQTR